MKKNEQFLLLTEIESTPQDWTFNGALTRELTHCYHDYPARMIPQIAGKLIDMFATLDANLLFDPYCGTGTSLVEGLIRGINVIGTDLNPLARLIARAKTSVPELQIIDQYILKFNRVALETKQRKFAETSEIPGINRLEFWFKPNVVINLRHVRTFIGEIDDDLARLFFQVAFSETVRESSNTRNEEFKLYRYDEARLEKFNPDVFEIMVSKLIRNRAGLHKFLAIMHNFKNPPNATICDFNTVNGISAAHIAPESVDIVVTSPPYGDSHTTVAYGQYSRLSAAWLGLEEPDKIDVKLMGGKVTKKISASQCESIDNALRIIATADAKRAHEVAAFYTDLSRSIMHVSKVLKPGGYACYVVGNRKVKGVVLPTDEAVRFFFESNDFEYIDTFHRSIPNKRMPLKNSPTNASGIVDNTMSREYIVIMRRKIPRTLREKRKKSK